MPVVKINGHDHHIDPSKVEATALGLSDDSAPSYILISLKEDVSLRRPQKTQLKDLDVEPQEYLHPDTYICAYNGSDLPSIRELDFVDHVEEYPVDKVVQPSLCDVQDKKERHTVDVTLHNDAKSSFELKESIAQAANVDVKDVEGDGGKVTLTVQNQDLMSIARIDAVRFIQEVHEAETCDESTHDTTSQLPYLVRDIIGANDISYKGNNQVIAIADSGFDTGSTENVQEAFKGRVKHLYALGRDIADDTSGHGTHVAGTALGNITSPNYEMLQAPACESILVMQSCDKRGDGSTKLGAIPKDLADLFKPPYAKDGARIHSNSWGTQNPTGKNQYTNPARSIDEFVWKNPDLVICFAAGNEGKCTDHPDYEDRAILDSKSITRAEAVAKNCITIGASENYLPNITFENLDSKGRNTQDFTYGAYFPKRFPKTPISQDHMSDQRHGLAAFSSRGPTQEERFKPDVVAPGTSILSTISHKCKSQVDYRRWGISQDAKLVFSSGTSMATPLVASCCAVIRQAVIDNAERSRRESSRETFSAALIKALLINGANDLRGQYEPTEAGPSPNAGSGFGLVNLKNSIAVIEGLGKLADYGIGSLDDSGENETFEVDVPVPEPDSGNVTLKATLVYSDHHGEALQNDLDLIVLSKGIERHGNRGAQDFEEGSLGAADFDRRNNVEQVVWEKIPAGDVKIRVRVHRMITKHQPFAYVWRLINV